MNNTQSLFGGANKFGGTTSSSNLFGSNTATGLGGFTTVSNVTGTTIKFQPLLASDVMIKNGSNQNISTRHQCITCMKEYENKSLEELRYEDYQANRKGTQASTMFSSAPSNQQTSSLFATNPSTVSFNTGQTSNSLFNTSKPAFGAGGATSTTATTSIFNSTFNKSFNTNAFGTTPQQTTQTSSLFGSNAAAATGAFGQPQPQQQQQQQQQPTNNLFNLTSQNTATANQVKPSFFATPTTQQTNSLFGNTAAVATNQNALGKSVFGNSAFGMPATSGTSFNFGGTTATQPATATSTSLFSNNQAGTSLFGNTAVVANAQQPKSMFNFPIQTTGLGGTQVGGGLSATGQQTSSLFNTTGLGGTTNSLFGNTTGLGCTAGSLYGNTNTNLNLFGSTTPANQTGMLSLQQISSPVSNMQTNDLLMNRLQSLPYGSSSLFQNKVSSPNSTSSLKFTTDPKVLNKYKVTFSNNNSNSSSNQVERVATSSIKNTSLLFDGLDDDNPDDKKTAFNIFVPRKNIKKLTIKPKENLSSSALIGEDTSLQFINDNSSSNNITLDNKRYHH